ncbi:MAG TPA: TolC family protein, partial [Lysobacter sp.]|nr:TolC family protein [Lysobacter sp.]
MASQTVSTAHCLHGRTLLSRSRPTHWFGALLIGLISWPALATDRLPGVDLASVHAWLREHNPQLQALQLEAEAADARVLPAGALPDPMLAVTLKEIDPDRPSLLPGNVGSTLYEVRQRIPLWGKRELSRELARNQAQGLRHEREAMAREILAEAEDAYVRYWHADEAVAIIDRQIVLLEQIEEVAGVRYAVGMAVQQDSIRAQVERTNMQRQRIERLAGRREAAVALNVALGRRADAALSPPAEQPMLVVRDSDIGEALARLQL